MSRIRRGGKRVRAGGGRTRNEDCCCEPAISVTLGNMHGFPTSPASDNVVLWCPPSDPYSRVFCTDSTVLGVNRYVYSERDFTALAGTYGFADPGATSWTVTLRDFADFKKYESATQPTCPTPGLGMGNIDSEVNWQYVRLMITGTGVSVGPGNITFTAVLREMEAAYPDNNATPFRAPIGKWSKTVTLGAGVSYQNLGDVTLDPDSSGGGSGVSGSDPTYGAERGNSMGIPVSSGGTLSCNGTQDADFATCILHFN